MLLWVPCPSVGTFHDLAILHVPAKYDKAYTFFNRYVLPVLVRRLSRVIAISQFSKRDLIEFARVPEERIDLILEAADSEIYFLRDGQAAARAFVERGWLQQPYVLYVARLEHPAKNHVRLIRAFTRLKEHSQVPHQLVLAGSDWQGAEVVRKEAAASTATQDIVLLGHVGQEDLPLLYSGADAFVFPSLFEGFGLPVLEAMASGIPVACSNAASIPEVAGSAALLFDPLDEAAIERSLREVLLDSEIRRVCVAAGLKQSAKFSWEKTAMSTMSVFRKLVPK